MSARHLASVLPAIQVEARWYCSVAEFEIGTKVPDDRADRYLADSSSSMETACAFLAVWTEPGESVQLEEFQGESTVVCRPR